MRKLLPILLLCVVVPSSIVAKSLSNREKRKIYMDVINAVEIYEHSATVRDNGSKYNFINMFRTPQTRIYCDLLDYHSGDGKIEVLEYLDLLSQKNLVEVKIHDLQRGGLYRKDDEWHMKVSFLKQLNYMDENEVWFSSKEYYGNDYHITMDFVYDESKQRCYVADIDGVMESKNAHLPQNFMVILYSSEKDEKLKVRDFSVESASSNKPRKSSYGPLQFNEFKQAYVRPNDVRPWNDNIHIKYDTLAKSKNYDYVKLKYRRSIWRAKLRYSYALQGAYDAYKKGRENIFDGFKKKDMFKKDRKIAGTNLSYSSSAHEVGLDLGITFSMGRSTQMGFYAGAAWQMSEISFFSTEKMSYKITSYSYNNTQSDFNENDSRPEKITHSYSDMSASQTVSYQDLVVPAYLGFDHRFGNAVSLTWSIGAKLYFNMKRETLSLKLLYDKQTFKQTSTSNEKITYEEEYDKFLYKHTFTTPKTPPISLTASLGLNFNLYKRYIYLSTKVGYEYGIKDVHSSQGGEFYVNSGSGKHYPLVYSAQLDRDVATHSIVDCVSYSHNALWLEAGLIFKF